MTKQNNKTCITCEKKYTYCNRCDDFATLPKWMTAWCSKRCKDIFNIASSYLTDTIDENEAKQRLESLTLSPEEHYSFGVQKALDKMKYFEVLPKESDNIEEEQVENDISDIQPVKVQARTRRKKEYIEQ